MNSLFLILSLAAVYSAAWWGYERYQSWRQRTNNGVELSDPFLAEVLLDGDPVATLTNRKVTEMFWRRYQLNPLPGIEPERIKSAELWTIPCGCTFRDPITGHVCRTAWTTRVPEIVNGVMIINLRNLYFKPEKN